jgi:hypothetical protein
MQIRLKIERPGFPVSKLVDTLRIFVTGKLEAPRSASYNAVTVAFTAKCCDAARKTHSKPLLVSCLPRLPLPECSMPEDCRCQFREWPDRRIGERRLPDDESSESVAGSNAQRRQGTDRRRK